MCYVVLQVESLNWLVFGHINEAEYNSCSYYYGGDQLDRLIDNN